MTNTPQIGDQTIITNSDGSVVVTTVVDVDTRSGFALTPIGWLIIAAAITAVVLVAIRLSKIGNKSN